MTHAQTNIHIVCTSHTMLCTVSFEQYMNAKYIAMLTKTHSTQYIYTTHKVWRKFHHKQIQFCCAIVNHIPFYAVQVKIISRTANTQQMKAIQNWIWSSKFSRSFYSFLIDNVDQLFIHCGDSYVWKFAKDWKVFWNKNKIIQIVLN